MTFGELKRWRTIVFYAVPTSYEKVEIRPGHFAVFPSGEGHLPLCHSRGQHELNKVVVKVRRDHWEARRK